jgi:hypothetical protein
MHFFLDVEFNGFGGQALSLAIVREDTTVLNAAMTSISLIFPIRDDIEPWVTQNVIPHQMKDPVAKRVSGADEASAIIQRLLRGHDPTIVADWPEDIMHFCANLMPMPGHMVNLGLNPVKILMVPRGKLATIPGAIEHQPWWDAMCLRHTLMPTK